MNTVEAIRKVFNSKNSVPDRDISSFELTPDVFNVQPATTFTINTQELRIDKDKTITPLIFCNRKYKTKIQTKSKRRLVVFENMLSNVVYAYYSSDYDIHSIMRSMTESIPVQEEIKKVEIEVKKKRGRKKKLNGKGKNSKDSKSNDSELNDNISLVDDQNLLDFLVSPLKHDFEFGWLIRKMVVKGNSDF